MNRGAPWRGFSYIDGREVTLTREEWRALIDQASRNARIGGDLILFGSDGRMTHEIYDKDRSRST